MFKTVAEDETKQKEEAVEGLLRARGRSIAGVQLVNHQGTAWIWDMES